MRQHCRNIFSLMIMICVCLCMTGCNGKKSEQADGKIRVVATVFAEYDFLRQIAGDTIELSMLMMPGADIHTFDPTPKDIKDVQDADLFVTIGGESDAWSETILESVDSNTLQVIRLMDLVENVVEEELVEGMQGEEEEESEESEEKEFDEHVWTSPKNAIQIVNGLCEKLCEIDKEHSDVFKKNTEDYIEKLKELDQKFTEVVEQGNRKEIVVADRFPFRYFVDSYNLDYYAAFPGCSTETGASAETIAFLIDKVKAEKIPVVFHMELSSEVMCDTICDATGAKKATLNAVHNISKTDFDQGIGYIELMEKNISVLKEALS